MSERRAWSFLTIQGYRQYGGNTGYADDPEREYRYDSEVANHLQVSVGDVVIIRSRDTVIGISEISTVEEEDGEKERLRCPQCLITNIKERKSRHPIWRCRHGHEFDEPDRSLVPVRKYKARYGPHFSPCSPEMTIATLEAAVLRPSDQMSIKEIDLAKIEASIGPSGAEVIRRFAGALEPSQPEGNEGAEISGSIIEWQRRVLREIGVRRGQKKFRDRLIAHYGARCQVSGCEFAELVEAAHIDPYSKSGDNSVQNGLLLRSDIHTLFDLGYLGIEPVTFSIKLHPAIRDCAYRLYEGRTLETNGTKGPALSALKRRIEFFELKLSGADDDVSSPAF